MTRIVKLPLIQNIGPNQRVSIRLPLGVTYNKIFLNFAGNILASLMTNIVVKINGQERQRWNTWAQLQARNSYNRGAFDTRVCEFDFIEREAKDEAAMTIGSYAATAEAGVQDFTIEFNLGAYAVDANSTITGFAEVDVPSPNTLIMRNRYLQKVYAGAQEDQIYIPSGLNGELLKRIYIFGNMALINHLRVRREGSDEFEQVTVIENEYLQKTYGKVPQAGLYVLDFTPHDLMGHMLNTAQIVVNKKAFPIQNLDVRLNVRGAGSFDIYTESITVNDRA